VHGERTGPDALLRRKGHGALTKIDAPIIQDAAGTFDGRLNLRFDIDS
jgi:hypothetical protein